MFQNTLAPSIQIIYLFPKSPAIRAKYDCKRMWSDTFSVQYKEDEKYVGLPQDRKYFLIPFQKLWLTWEMGIVHAKLEKPIWAKSTIYHDRGTAPHILGLFLGTHDLAHTFNRSSTQILWGKIQAMRIIWQDVTASL